MRKVISTRLAAIIVAGIFAATFGLGLSFFLFFQDDSSSIDGVPVTRVASPANAQELQNSFRTIIANVLPSIITIQVAESREQPTPNSELPWFDFFFGRPNNEEQPQFRSQAFGSGIIVRKDGATYYALTNEHVVGDADSITVILYDQNTVEASLVGKDTRKDIALISFQYTKDELTPAPLGDSDLLQVGDWALAIGSPFNLQSTVTAGIVSALGRRGGPQGNINDFIQTDAAINQGNSGGALVNIYGEVVGMNTWITSRTGTNIGLGFSIPINNIKKPIEDFLASGSVQYGWLGVSIGTLSLEEAMELNLTTNKGAFVVNVFNGSPADNAGVIPGDFITSLNGEQIEDSETLLLEVGDLPVGKSADIALIRQGNQVNLKVRITAREEENVIATQNNELWPGMKVVAINEQRRTDLELDSEVQGVIVARVDEDSPASIAGLRPNDVITTINDNSIEDVPGFYRQLNAQRRGKIDFTFVRTGQTLNIGIVR